MYVILKRVNDLTPEDHVKFNGIHVIAVIMNDIKAKQFLRRQGINASLPEPGKCLDNNEYAVCHTLTDTDITY